MAFWGSGSEHICTSNVRTCVEVRYHDACAGVAHVKKEARNEAAHAHLPDVHDP